MQQKPPNIEENLIAEMEQLITSIKKAENNIGENDLAVNLGYRSGYISECRSRGKASVKFINRLKGHLATLENPKSAKPAPVEEMQGNIDYDSRMRLETTLLNLSEDKIRSTAIIERLMTIIEKQFNYAPTGKVPSTPPANNTPVDDPAFEDARLGSRSSQLNKDNHQKKGT